MSAPHERRASPRCDAVKNQSRVQFLVPGGVRGIEARLVNISRDGALLVTQNRPPSEPHIWLRIESPVKTDWVGATIVRIGQDREVALQFPRRCPDDVLLAGSIGIDLTSMILGGADVASVFD